MVQNFKNNLLLKWFTNGFQHKKCWFVQLILWPSYKSNWKNNVLYARLIDSQLDKPPTIKFLLPTPMSTQSWQVVNKLYQFFFSALRKTGKFGRTFTEMILGVRCKSLFQGLFCCSPKMAKYERNLELNESHYLRLNCELFLSLKEFLFAFKIE